MKTAIELVIEERRRQIEEEGNSIFRDDGWKQGELAAVAACYALSTAGFPAPHTIEAMRPPVTHKVPLWPWGPTRYKPGSILRALIKAAALLVAEIERRQRLGEIP